MGIRAGAEMTTFEMRFIALRCKDTIAPTGTIAQGVGAQQVNSLGENYEAQYGRPKTSLRLYSTVRENEQGRGPCYLQTAGITAQQESELYKAYLNMAPGQTLRWVENGQGPRGENVEMEGTEPYGVGGHTGSGYWVDTGRATTLAGLFAAGDVAGGSPQKYVTGCLAEGEIAAESALKYSLKQDNKIPAAETVAAKRAAVQDFLSSQPGIYTSEDLEDAMQKVMDTYAGGISTYYAYNSTKLQVAKSRINDLLGLTAALKARDALELMRIYEVIDRLYVCKVLLCHLEARRETRWHSFQENLDYPHQDDQNWLKFVNTRYDGKLNAVRIVLRDLVKKDDIYEHSH